VILAGLPAAAAAQHKSTLPPIGGPLPRIGLEPLPSTPWWERQQTPWWERRNPPSWEKGHVPDRVRDERPRHRGGIIGPSVVYVMPAYPYFPFEPEPIVVTRPAPPAPPAPPAVSREEIEREVERIVEERLRERAQPPPAPSVEPAPAPAGSKTLYVIPGCYMGNVSPEAMKLPAGCDLDKLVIVTP
jgi:hypothetical protein